MAQLISRDTPWMGYIESLWLFVFNTNFFLFTKYIKDIWVLNYWAI